MKLSGYTLVLMTAFFSGFAIWINKFSIGGFNPFVYTGTRNILIALFLFMTILILGNFKKLKNLSGKEWRYLITIGIVGGSIPFLLFFYGLKITSAVNAAFIHKTIFVYVSIMAFFFLKEKLSKKQILGSMGLLAGLFFLIGLPTSFDLGASLVLIATLFWAIENVISKYVLNQNVNPTLVAFGRMFFGSLVIFAFLILTGDVAQIALFSIDQVIWILFPLILLYGYVMTWYHGISKIQVSEATAILILGSAITTLLNFTYTSLTPEKWLGTILIIASVGFIIFGSAKASRLMKEMIPFFLGSKRKSS